MPETGNMYKHLPAQTVLLIAQLRIDFETIIVRAKAGLDQPLYQKFVGCLLDRLDDELPPKDK